MKHKSSQQFLSQVLHQCNKISNQTHNNRKATKIRKLIKLNLSDDGIVHFAWLKLVLMIVATAINGYVIVELYIEYQYSRHVIVALKHSRLRYNNIR